MRDAAAAFLDFVFCFLILFSIENVLANLENTRRLSPPPQNPPGVAALRPGATAPQNPSGAVGSGARLSAASRR